MKRITALTIAAGIAFLLATGCNNPFSSEKKEKRQIDTSYNPVIKPENFVARIDNNYSPMKPGTKYIYRGATEDGIERNEVSITHQTKTILGVVCTIVEDKVWLNEQLVESTLDWYAQDKDGNVWYFGEDSKEYKNGNVVSTEGSWEAGVDGAKPGIIMKANPQVGDSYRQEYLFNEAEDMAEVLGLNESANVPYGTFTNCLKTKDWSPLETDVIENKYYLPGIGFVMSKTVKGDMDTVELVDILTE
jgi:hypothetical protein